MSHDLLPVSAVLPRLLRVLEGGGNAVLVAPPGAGKTTGVPPALLKAPWRGEGRLVVVEPRRLAARAAAARVAEGLGEAAGGLAGYRVRNETRVSPRTRIEFVTAGVFVRMILEDPALDGVAAVLFDEVHERGLDVDLGLALALEAQEALRPDLRLVAMSATVDGARFAALMGDAPVVESEGRLHPVETIYPGAEPGCPLEESVARAVRRALGETGGSILAFLPGQREILRTAGRLEGRVPADVAICPLYGTMDARAQDAAIRPPPSGRRKVVLATSIAETSLTIDGVRVVVDSGLARRPRYDPGSGLTRLETVRVSRAAADQRRGRAGRTGPGVCYRLWDEPQTAALAPYDTPEILASDLSDLALSLMAWGTSDPAALRWLDAPPAAAYQEALDLLDRLGARDPAGGLSAHGRHLAALPLPPRLAHMVLLAAAAGEAGEASEIAAVLSEPGLGGRDVDLTHRLEAFRRDRSPRARASRAAAGRWAERAAGAVSGEGGPPAGDPATWLALAYPERVARQRGGRGRFVMAGGRGARLDESEALAGAAFLAIGEVAGGGPEPRILLAAPLEREAIEAAFADRLRQEDDVAYDAAADLVRGRRTLRLDAVVLREAPLERVDPDQAARLLAQAAVRRGIGNLPWPSDLRGLRERVGFLRRHDGGWPDLSDDALAVTSEAWLVPALAGRRRLAEVTGDVLRGALAALLPWDRMQELDRRAPARFEAPSGEVVAIDYSGEEPVVRIRVQGVFGLREHPAIDGVPILFELLSPAGRPVQVTRDLPGFWAGSWRDVRAEMRGRYPKHDWPEDPATAVARRGAKPRPR